MLTITYVYYVIVGHMISSTEKTILSVLGRLQENTNVQDTSYIKRESGGYAINISTVGPLHTINTNTGIPWAITTEADAANKQAHIDSRGQYFNISDECNFVSYKPLEPCELMLHRVLAAMRSLNGVQYFCIKWCTANCKLTLCVWPGWETDQKRCHYSGRWKLHIHWGGDSRLNITQSIDEGNELPSYETIAAAVLALRDSVGDTERGTTPCTYHAATGAGKIMVVHAEVTDCKNSELSELCGRVGTTGFAVMMHPHITVRYGFGWIAREFEDDNIRLTHTCLFQTAELSTWVGLITV